MGMNMDAKVELVPDTRNIHQRLHAVMKEVDYVQKDRDVGKYKVVSHDAVTAKVRPVLVKHGVIYYPQNMTHLQDGNRTEVHLDIVFVNIDDPSDKIAVPTFGYGIDTQDKGPGKSVSYAVKMALLKALGLETGEDADDGTNADHVPSHVEIPVITKEQVAELVGLIKETGADADRFCNFMQVTDITNIAVGDFQKAKHALEQKRKAKDIAA